MRRVDVSQVMIVAYDQGFLVPLLHTNHIDRDFKFSAACLKMTTWICLWVPYVPLSAVKTTL